MFEELSVGLEALTERTSQVSKRIYTNMAIFGEKKCSMLNKILYRFLP